MINPQLKKRLLELINAESMPEITDDDLNAMCMIWILSHIEVYNNGIKNFAKGQ